MPAFTNLLMSSFKYFGLGGCVIVTFCVILAALGYKGKKHEPYSVFNHFISELGEVGVSGKAWVFNNGMIVGGISLLPFVIGLGFYVDNIWAKLGIAAGIWASLSCACVGIFPMNDLTTHLRAAISYFRSGLVMVVLFAIAILAQPAEHTSISQYANIVSLLAVLSYGSFLRMLTKKEVGSQLSLTFDPENMPDRPRVWIFPLLEWTVFFSTILWIFGIASVI